MSQKEQTLKPYHTASDEEYEARNCADEYDLLIGPGGFECLLTEPEDRNWYRDGKGVIDELNRLYTSLTTPQQEASDRDEFLTIKQRDDAENCIDKLLDLIGVEYEWSSSFGFPDAIEASNEKLATIRADERRKEDRLIKGIKVYMSAYCPGHISLDLSAYYEMIAILGETTP